MLGLPKNSIDIKNDIAPTENYFKPLENKF